jgi:hypothetical protein
MIFLKKILKCLFSSTKNRNIQDIPKPVSQIYPEDIRQFLPTFLSQGSESAFLDEIKNFLKKPENNSFYTNALRTQPFIFQGDSLENLKIFNLPDTSSVLGKGIIFSNSCDINPENNRLFDSSLCYAPIFSLPAYLEALRKKFSEERVASHERDLRAQSITQIFFLPQGGKLKNDAIVFFDRIISVRGDTIDRKNLTNDRLFTLSDFGAWLFTLKLSIHFCRIRDKVDRNAGIVN